MELFVIRHGKAEASHPLGDAARPLVAKGYEQAQKIGRMLKRIERCPHVVLTSPLVRARQTAETLCQAAEIPGPVIQGWLACGMDPEEAIRELTAFRDFERVAIVGHEPDLSSFIEWILGCAGSTVEVRKGSISCLEVNPPGWHARLLFHLPPALLLD